MDSIILYSDSIDLVYIFCTHDHYRNPERKYNRRLLDSYVPTPSTTHHSLFRLAQTIQFSNSFDASASSLHRIDDDVL